jgi:hypothetical protein
MVEIIKKSVCSFAKPGTKIKIVILSEAKDLLFDQI